MSEVEEELEITEKYTQGTQAAQTSAPTGSTAQQTFCETIGVTLGRHNDSRLLLVSRDVN